MNRDHFGNRLRIIAFLNCMCIGCVLDMSNHLKKEYCE